MSPLLPHGCPLQVPIHSPAQEAAQPVLPSAARPPGGVDPVPAPPQPSPCLKLSRLLNSTRLLP